MPIGSEIQARRVASGIVGSLVCLKTGISRSRLSDIERGYVEPRETEIVRIKSALDDLERAKRNIDAVVAAEGWHPDAMQTNEQLTALLAESLMGWTPAPDRFLLPNRRWMPRWRFQPFKKLSDAFQLLEESKTERFSMGSDGDNELWVRVEIGGRVGKARDKSKPRAITLAIARAVGIALEDGGQR